MANYPINPYGQNAQMPEGYPIADNLRTDSAQQALSARQGKKLGDFASTNVAVDTSLVSEVVGILLGPDDNNKWASNTSFRSKLIPVDSGKTYKIEAVNGWIVYAVLASNELTNEQVPNYATGTTGRTELSLGESAEITIPVNGEYLCVLVKSSDNNREPLISTVLNADNSTLGEIIEGVAGAQSLPIAKREIVVAANDAPAWQKVNADFLCDGVNDELTIQQAINSLPDPGGRIRLTSGTYIIDSFPNDRANSIAYVDQESGDSHRYAAIMFPNGRKHITLEGDTFRTTGPGTILRVSDTCYGNIGANDLRVIIATQYPLNSTDQMYSNNMVTLRNLNILIPWNQKPIMCIDMMFTGRPDLQNINCQAYINDSVHAEWEVTYNAPVPIAVPHCVGIRSTGGSNMGLVNNYINLGVSGFYEGYKFSGEHVFGVHCGALMCYYGFTFGNFTYTHGCLHAIVLINSGDERCCCGPYFGICTDRQRIDLLNWNNEIGASYIPGGVRIKEATEKVPGTFCGRIEYTRTKGDDNASPRVPWNSAVDSPFWERGHGHGFFTRNMFHKLACTTSERNSYAPDYMEHIWDTTLGKEVICVDETNRVWKDAAGNIV